MSDLGISAKDVVLVIIPTIVAPIVVFLGYKLWNFLIQTRPFHAIWGFKNNDTVYLVNGVIETRSKDLKNTFVLRRGDVLAITDVASSLERRYSRIRIKNVFSAQLPASEMVAENIVSIGGPVRNSVTSKLMGLCETRYKFDSEENMIDSVSGTRYSPKKSPLGDYYEIDYGFIMKTRHPSDAAKLIIVIAGCHTEGTMGAARYCSCLSRAGEDRIRRLYEEFGKEPFQIAIEAGIVRDALGLTEIGKLKRIDVDERHRT